MIKVALYENIFETAHRELREYRADSATLREIVSSLGQDGAEYAVFLNGGYCKDLNREAVDGDTVSMLAAPDGLELAWYWWVVIAAAAFVAIDALIIDPLVEDLQQQQQDLQEAIRDGAEGTSAVNTYYGFQNNYYPLGEAIPVVYGNTQVAPICVHKSVVSNFTPADSPFDWNIAINEVLNVLMLIGHGPIEGVGKYRAKVSNADELSSAISQFGASVPEKTALRINNIPGKHVDHSFRWRTGELDQTPIRGASAGIYSPYDAGQSYVLNAELNLQTPNIGAASKPAGVYSYANRIVNSDPLKYASQLFTAKADKASVTVLFERGLYTGFEDGDPDPATASFRIQYWETDSVGNPAGNVIVLPELDVTLSLTTPFSVDFPIALQSSTNASLERLGYSDIKQSAGKSLQNVQNTNAADTNWVGGSGAFINSTWTFACWASLKISQAAGMDNLTLASFGPEIPSAINNQNALGLNMPRARTQESVSGTSQFVDFQQTSVIIKLQRDSTNAFGNGSDKIYLTMYCSAWRADENDLAGQCGMIFGKRSEFPIGSSQDAIDGYWPSPGATAHIGVINEIAGSPGSQYMRQKAYVNGVEVPLINMQNGDWWQSRGGNNIGSGFSNYATSGITSLFVGGVTTEFVEDCLFRARQFGVMDLASATYGSVASIPSQFQTYLCFGAQGDSPTTQSVANSEGHLAQVIFHKGGEDAVRDSGWFSVAAAGSSSPDVHTFDCYQEVDTIEASQFNNGVVMRCDEDERSGTTLPNQVTTSPGDMTIDATQLNDTGGSVYLVSFTDSEPSYFQLEIFRSSADAVSTTGEQTKAVVRRITTAATRDEQYPGVALAALSISASDQLRTSTPRITFDVYGLRVPVIKGFSGTEPIISVEWSDNPAYIALDMLSNREYGMGSVFAPEGTFRNFDLRQFYDWGQFCDEAVPDAYGELEFYKIVTNDGLDGYLGVYIGLTSLAGSDQEMPSTWAQGNFFSLSSVLPAGISSDWITAQDSQTGLNNASALMEIVAIQFGTDDEATDNGYSSIVKITCQWNRVDSEGNFDFPVEGSFAASDYGLSSLGTCGQYEHRCRFDGFFDARRQSSWEAAMLVFHAGRAMPVKLGSRISPVWDRPRDPVGMVTQANIIADSLKISYINPFTRANSLEVEFNDRDIQYEKNRVVVDHESIQSPESFSNIKKERKYRRGVVRRSQIIRDAYYELNKMHLQRRQYEFALGPDALHLIPGDRLLLSHDIANYGVSGRLAGDFSSANTFPSGTDLSQSLTVNGGRCVITNASVMDADDTAPPDTAYSSGTTHAYGTPTINLGSGYVNAGEYGGNGYESHPIWGSQHIAVANGFYPTPDYSGGLLAPLGRITRDDQRVEFSLYVKEPDGGAAEKMRMGIYRICDDVGYVQAFEGVIFAWSSGALVFDSYSAASGSAAMSYTVSYAGNGWYRAAILYNNNLGAGAAGVGDYLQARVFFAYDSTQTFKTVATGGRGNQFFKFGDPLNIETAIGGASPWVRANGSTGSNSIAHATAIAPPLYIDEDQPDTLGDHGHVVQMTKDGSLATGTTPPLIRQRVVMPTGTAVSSWNGERICMTGYARLNSATSPTSPQLVVNLRNGTAVDGNGIPTGDGVTLTLSAAAASSSWTAATSTTAASGTVANVASSVAPARLKSSANSTDWVEFNVSFDYTPSAGQFGTMTVSLHADEGGSTNATIDIWGLRVHGAGGLSASPASGDLVNPHVHKGLLLWGAQFVEDSAWSGSGSATAFSPGGGLVLDRDITLEAGKSYEVQIRSSGQIDVTKNTEAIERLDVSQQQIPASGSTVIPAGTSLLVSPPTLVSPLKGDLYAFGEIGQGIKDIVIESISLDPKDLTRDVRATDYNEGFYEDTSFAKLDEVDVAGLDRNSGTVGQMGYGGSELGTYPFQGVARYSNFRNRDGGVSPAVDIQWTVPEGEELFAEVAIYWSRLTSDGKATPPTHIATVRASDRHYRYQAPSIKPGSRHRFTLQRVGKKGTRESLKRAPFVDVRCEYTATIPTAPTVSVDYEAFRQIYTADPTGDNRVHSIEGRIGGWIISSPGFILDPDDGRSISDSLIFTSENAAGEKHVSVYARSKLANGQYGVAAQVLPESTLGFKDGRSTAENNSEDGYATAGILPLDLAVASGELHWSSSSTSLGPVYYEQNEIDLTTATRAIASCVIQGYQTRPETLADLDFQLGSDLGRRWSIEGPMDVTRPTVVNGIDLTNASVKIEWRWTSGASLSGVDYQEFVPQEVYFRKCQFRLVFTRPTTGFDTFVQRMSTLVTLPPLQEAIECDGGTF